MGGISVIVDGQKTRSLREQNSWSRLVLAQKARLAGSTIERVEKKAVASLQTIRFIAFALNVSIEDLLPAEADQKGKIDLLPQITNGKTVCNIVAGADLFESLYEEPPDKNRQVIGEFLQNAQDCSEAQIKLDDKKRAGNGREFSEQISQIASVGFLVFGARRKISVLVKKGKKKTRKNMSLAVFYIVKKNNPMIIPAGKKQTLDLGLFALNGNSSYLAIGHEANGVVNFQPFLPLYSSTHTRCASG